MERVGEQAPRQVEWGAEGPAHYFGDRQRGFAILIAACLDSPNAAFC
jgi:hypothetical protein